MNGDSQKLIMFVHEGIRQLCSKLKDLIEQDGLAGSTSENKVALNHLWKTKLYRTYGQISNLEMKFAPPGSKTFSSVFEPFIEWLICEKVRIQDDGVGCVAVTAAVKGAVSKSYRRLHQSAGKVG